MPVQSAIASVEGAEHGGPVTVKGCVQCVDLETCTCTHCIAYLVTLQIYTRSQLRLLGRGAGHRARGRVHRRGQDVGGGQHQARRVEAWGLQPHLVSV